MRSGGLTYDASRLVRSEVRPSTPVEFAHVEGDTVCDVVGTTYPALTIVSDKFVDVLLEHGFSGWTTFPVGVQQQDGTQLQGLSGLAVNGRCGPIDDSLSQRITLPPPVAGGRSAPGLLGLCFKPESWDGSALFVAEGSTSVFVTEPVKDALERARITNVAFHRLSDIERTWRADGGLVVGD